MTIAAQQAAERSATTHEAAAPPPDAAPPPACAAPIADTPTERPARLRPALASQTRRMTAALPPGAWQAQAGMQLRALAQAVQQEQEQVSIELGVSGGDDDTVRDDTSIAHELESQAAAEPGRDGLAVASAAQAGQDFASADESHDGSDGGAHTDVGADPAPHVPAAAPTSIVDEVNRRIDRLPELRSPTALVEAVLACLHAAEERCSARLVLLGHCGAPVLEHTPTGQAQLLAVLQALSTRRGAKRLLLACSPHHREGLPGPVVRWAMQHGFTVHGHDLFGTADAAQPAFRSDARERAMASAIADALREVRLVIASAASLHLAALHQALAPDHETIAIAIALVARVADGDEHGALRMRELLASGIVTLKPAPALEHGDWATPQVVGPVLEHFATWRTSSPLPHAGRRAGPSLATRWTSE